MARIGNPNCEHGCPPIPSTECVSGPGDIVTLSDYITDGSLARICRTLAELTGVTPFLRDASGALIHTTSEGLVDPAMQDREAPEASFEAPIMVTRDGSAPEPIGSLCLPVASSDAGGGAGRPLAEQMLQLLSLVVAESCNRQIELARRLDDLNSLLSITGRLATTRDLQDILQVTLDAALGITSSDAGSVRLYDEESGELRLEADHGLTEGFRERAVVLLRDSPHDQCALDHALCCVADIESESSFVLAGPCENAGFVTCMLVGLTYQGAEIGTIRLYSRAHRTYSPRQGELLVSVSKLSAAAIAYARLMRERRTAREVERQVRLAADVQRRMLPRDMPQYQTLDIAARYIPGQELAGDFYDLFDLEGHLGFVIGDVVGKGVAAALLMASVRSALRAYAQNIYNINEIVERTNEAMARDTLPNEFATLFYGVIDPVTLRMTYVNAGHDHPIVVRMPEPGSVASADIVELRTGGLPVGINPDEPYCQGELQLQPGDALLCYTDGLAEAMNFDDACFGRPRVRQSVVDVLTFDPDADANRVLSHALWEMRRFAGLRTRPDDLTLLAVRVQAAH